MMQKIQKFGGAMFTPVMLFAFAGVVIGFGTLFTTEVIFGPLAAPDTMWYGVWNVILQGGWTGLQPAAVAIRRVASHWPRQ